MSEALRTMLLVYTAALLTVEVFELHRYLSVLVVLSLFGGLVAGLYYYGGQPTKGTS